MPPLQYTNRSSLHLRIYTTKLATLSYDYDNRELITLPDPAIFEPRKELNPFTSFEEAFDDRDLIPLHEEELTLIQLAAELKIPTKEDFQWWYHDDQWKSIEDEELLSEPYDFAIHKGGKKRQGSRNGWTNYGTSVKLDDFPLSLITVLYRPKPPHSNRPKPLYSPALIKTIQSPSTKKRPRCPEDSSPSPQPEVLPNPPLGANDYLPLPPQKATTSCQARTTRPIQKKRKLIHSRYC